jgi:hypothetical protein
MRAIRTRPQVADLSIVALPTYFFMVSPSSDASFIAILCVVGGFVSYERVSANRDPRPCLIWNKA